MSQDKEATVPELVQGIKCKFCGDEMFRRGEQLVCKRCNRGCRDDHFRSLFVRYSTVDDDSIH